MNRISKKKQIDKKNTRANRPISKDIPYLETIKEEMFIGPYGPKIRALWNGDTSMFRGNHSSADLSLCRYLALYSKGASSTMDLLFRQSSLYRPKWDERRGSTTYGGMTIAKALKDEGYSYETHATPPKKHPNDFAKKPIEVDTSDVLSKIKEILHDLQCGIMGLYEENMTTILQYINSQEEKNHILLQKLANQEVFNQELLHRLDEQNKHNQELLQLIHQQQKQIINITEDHDHDFILTEAICDTQEEQQQLSDYSDVLGELNELYEGIKYTREDEKYWYFNSEFEEMKVEKEDYALWYKDLYEGWLFSMYLFVGDKTYDPYWY